MSRGYAVTFDEVAMQAQGRWPYILPELGVDPKYLTGKAMACPLCGEGDDRFVFDDKEGHGTFICRRCGAGNGFILVERVQNVSRAKALRMVAGALGLERVKSARPAPVKRGASPREAKARLKAVLDGTRPLSRGDLVHRYLNGRGLPSRSWRNLYFHPSLNGKGVKGAPAMVAKVHHPATGRVHTAHRTFLTPEGRKIDGAAAKQIMPVVRTAEVESWVGGAVRLYDIPEGATVLAVAEGIETALAAAEVFRMPAWATLTAQGLEEFIPPEGVTHLVIAADHDRNGVGQAAAHRLAARAYKLGLTADVQIAPDPGSDWLDAYVAAQGKAAA